MRVSELGICAAPWLSYSLPRCFFCVNVLCGCYRCCCFFWGGGAGHHFFIFWPFGDCAGNWVSFPGGGGGGGGGGGTGKNFRPPPPPPPETTHKLHPA